MFYLNDLIEALEHMPFLENELAYLSISGQCENTLRDRLGYFLANRNNQKNKEEWSIFFPKEVNVRNQRLDLAVVEGIGDIEERLVAIMEFKRFYLTEILYGNEFHGRKQDSGTKQKILRDIDSRFDLIQEIRLDSGRPIKQFQILFISQYSPDEMYYLISNRSQIYTHEIARNFHIEAVRQDGGLVRKFKELNNLYSPNSGENCTDQDGIINQIKKELKTEFGNRDKFTVNIMVGLLDKETQHRYHYFNVTNYFAVLEIIPR